MWGAEWQSVAWWGGVVESCVREKRGEECEPERVNEF